MITVWLLNGLVIVIFLVMAQYVYYDWKLGAAATPSSSRAIRAVIDVLPENAKNIIELGSGWGGMAKAVAQARPDAQVTGIEFALWPYLASKLKAGGLSNLTFLRQDFFKYDLSTADVVLCYMPPEMMERLPPKLKADLKSGAVIISNSADLPGFSAEKSVQLTGFLAEKILVYKVV
ncbi:MAG: class I SAM-dependent methyltransferase [Alphaproteobacteria bacterium]|nr:class I SAM-dependent methyltransferase [Alphaproteobacteria bacterium]